MKYIFIKGARHHNLKNIDVRIPKAKFIVVCGVSGSGKSSLIFDTLYAEAQRKYVESLSLQKIQRIPPLPQPDVDYIEGTSPAIAVKEISRKNPRSTVATFTGIYDYLRVLFASVGEVFCPECSLSIKTKSITKIAEELLLMKEKRAMLLAPLKGEGIIEKIQSAGFVKVRINGEIQELPQREIKSGEIEVVIDRLILKEENKDRLIDSLQTTAQLTGGVIKVCVDGEEQLFSSSFTCPRCLRNYGEIKPSLFSFNSPDGACPLCTGIGSIEGKPCSLCNGARLKKESLSVKIEGFSIAELCKMSAKKCEEFFASFPLKKEEVKRLIPFIKRRLSALVELSLSYIILDRPISTLSYGEAQRVQLASHICSGMGGMLYLFEEPTSGLSPRECKGIIKALKKLKEEQNTVVVLEHKPEVITEADYIIELGPGAGEDGGWIINKGTLKKFLRTPSPTTKLLKGALFNKEYERKKAEKYMEIKGASAHNLKNIDVKIPLHLFTCITGCSGAGKSTLLEVIYMTFKNNNPFGCKDFKSEERLHGVIYMEQTPLGKNARSCPATYIGVMDDVREHFSLLKEARIKGYGPERFSFNNPLGACMECNGEGVVRKNMYLLEDIVVLCNECGGKRYNKEILRVKYKGKDIGDVLLCSVDEALSLFSSIPSITKKLSALKEVGLGYLKLGQGADTLSGGEAQRLRLAKAILKGGRDMLYLFDEPTLGLHPLDIERIIYILRKLSQNQNTVIAATQNPYLLKGADYIIELGPGAGEDGGWIIREGGVL